MKTAVKQSLADSAALDSNTLHFARALLEAMILETIGRKCGKRKNKKMFSNEMKLVNF